MTAQHGVGVIKRQAVELLIEPGDLDGGIEVFLLAGHRMEADESLHGGELCFYIIRII